MAEVEIELKDEELLDFDGSDYEFGSDEGVGGDEGEIEHHKGDSSSLVASDEFADGSAAQHSHKPAENREEAVGFPSFDKGIAKLSSTATNTELEDGELSDMAMVTSKKQSEQGVVKDVRHSRKLSNDTMRDFSDREAERNGDTRNDRKRRRDYDYEKHHHQYSSRERKEPYDRHMGRYDRSSYGGGDRRHDRFQSLPDPRNRGRSNSHAQHFRANLAPGIMGPGRPLRPDMNYHHIRPSTAGLEIFSPAQLQELLNQEHMLRSQQMLHSRLGIHPPGQGMYPNFLRPPPPLPAGSDLVPRLNFMGPNFPVAARGILGGGVVGYMRPPQHSRDEARGARVQPRSAAAAAAEVGSKHSARGKQDSQQPRRGPPQDDRRRSDRDLERRLGSASANGEKSQSAPHSKANDYNGNLIQLGGPVQKSRVLTVSGLVENTPMSAIADAFEKQGKILDFCKNQRGDVFTITFSSVQEALSAKRHLHRSILAGRQITVDYAV